MGKTKPVRLVRVFAARAVLRKRLIVEGVLDFVMFGVDVWGESGLMGGAGWSGQLASICASASDSASIFFAQGAGVAGRIGADMTDTVEPVDQGLSS